MALPLSTWPRRRVGALWAAGLLLEAALLAAMAAVFVRPDPALMARRPGGNGGPLQVYTYDAERGAGGPVPGATVPLRPAMPPGSLPGEPEDSFYTALRWSPGRPPREGGARVVALPMRLWWVPALYVGAVPLALVVITGAWLWARRRPAPGLAPPRSAA